MHCAVHMFCWIRVRFSKYIEEGHTMQDFKDVSENHWAYMAIKELSDKGIINGYPDGTFKPDKPITRAEVCSIISSILED